MTWLDWSRAAYVGLCTPLVVAQNNKALHAWLPLIMKIVMMMIVMMVMMMKMMIVMVDNLIIMHCRVKEHDHGIEDFKSDENKVNYCW